MGVFAITSTARAFRFCVLWIMDGLNYIEHGVGVCVFMLGVLTVYYDDP